MHPLQRARTGLALAAVASLGGVSVAAWGGVIPQTQITFVSNNSPDANITAGMAQTPSGVISTSVFFNYTGATLTAVAGTLDEGSDWYLVNPGDVFSAPVIAANYFTVILEVGGGGGAPVVSIPLGDFYVGVSTGVGFTDGLPNRDVFGWLELNNTGTELIPVGNAVDYGDGGIIVGTTTPAPEPASLLVLAGGLGILAIRRRGRCDSPPGMPSGAPSRRAWHPASFMNLSSYTNCGRLAQLVTLPS